MIINYQKRTNDELFKSLEKEDFTDLQNYLPIYNKFFSLNEKNYNSFNLNNLWYLKNIKHNLENQKNIYNCILKNLENNKNVSKDVFIKFAPLIDPYKCLVGKIKIENPELFIMPSLKQVSVLLKEDVKLSDCKEESTKDEINENIKEYLLDENNSAYVDGLFVFFTDKLLEKGFLHGLGFYGSFLANKQNFTFNIFDDLDYLNENEYFIKNKNVLFKVDDYSHIIECKNKKIPITIENEYNDVLSVCSVEDFNNIFEINDKDVNSEEYTSLKEIKEIKEDYIDFCNEKNNSISLKSGSSCSSRTSYTTNPEDLDLNQNNVNLKDDSVIEVGGDNECEEGGCVECDEDCEEEEDTGEEEEGEDWEDVESEYEEDEIINAVLPKFPVEIICMENCENTLDNYILNEIDDDESKWFSMLMQIIMILITYQKIFSFTHNDLHTNNIMYITTYEPFLFYCYNKKYYKVPTHGKIFKIIDFGRSIFKIKNNTFYSNCFKKGENASTQYNTEPYLDETKPRIEPNFSFDLCRLACSIFDYIVEDMDEIQNLDNCNPVIKLITEWCSDDRGIHLLYKKNGAERYPDFKLYKMIARNVHNHTPDLQLNRNEFLSFRITQKEFLLLSKKNISFMNIDQIIENF